MNSFSHWLENDIYGFDKIQAHTPKTVANDQPIQEFSIPRLLQFLLRKKIGEKIPDQRFTDEIRWGHGSGTLRIKITPNRNIVIARLSNDLIGGTFWVCKRVYRINDDFAGKEDAVAIDIFHKLEKIAHEPLDAAVRGWPRLEDFVRKTARSIKSTVPAIFSDEEIKQTTEHDYIIYFAIRGSGRGVVVQRRNLASYAPYLTVDLSYDPERGICRVIIATTSISERGGSWNVEFPYLDERFSPTQPADEVIQAISTAIRYL